MTLLEVRGLSVAFDSKEGPVHVLRNLSFELMAGDALGVVGPSGTGKSTLALALLGLSGPGARVTGSLCFDGKELAGDRVRAVRGAGIGMVFQDALASLNPYLTVGDQLAETLRFHRELGHAAAWAEAARLLDAVRIADVPRRLFQYPHQLSGGMRQRVMIALALAPRPRLLLADEPTASLDVTVQAQVLKLLDELRRDLGLSLLLISHDRNVIRRCCEHVLELPAARTVDAAGAEGGRAPDRLPEA